MKRLILAILCAVLLIASGCSLGAAKTVTQTIASTTVTQWTAATTVTQPGATSVITQPAQTTTIISPPLTSTVTAPPVTTTVMPPPVTNTVTSPPLTSTVTLPPVTSTVTTPPVTTTVTFTPTVTLTAAEAIELSITPLSGDFVTIPDSLVPATDTQFMVLSYHNTENKSYSVRFKITLYVSGLTFTTAGDGVTITSAATTPLWARITNTPTLMVYQTVTNTTIAANAEGDIILQVVTKYTTGAGGYMFPQVIII
jgi:hypothetical protein